jgi:purine-binding chemotaxis protein CheW
MEKHRTNSVNSDSGNEADSVSADRPPAKRDSEVRIEDKREMSLEEKKVILRERARKLAHKPESGDQDGECLVVVEFMLAHERYAIEMDYIREVYPLRDLTPVPCTPSFVLGIINVRGQVISVADVKEFFDLPKKDLTDDHRVLIVGNDNMDMGILADRVVGERRIPLHEIQAELPTLKSVREGYIRGVTKDRLVVMNINKLLNDENIVVHQEVGD